MRGEALACAACCILFAFAGLVIACEDDSLEAPGLDAGNLSPVLDSGSSPFDADTAPTDAGVDAPAPPAVTVTVTGALGPKANVRVVFHDASGAVMSTKLTGADGKAALVGTLPSMVSALLGTTTDHHILTWTGVENGDDLVVRDVESGAYIGRFNVALAGGDFTDAGTTSYHLTAGSCSASVGLQGTSLDLYRDCVGAESALLVEAQDRVSTMLGHTFKKGNLVPLDGGVVDVTTGGWKAPGSVNVSLANLPASTIVAADLLEIVGGHGYATNTTREVRTASAAFRTADGFAEALQASVRLPPLAANGRQLVARRVPPAATIALDAAQAQALPGVSGASIANTDTLRPVLVWTGATTTMDGGLVRVRFRGSERGQYHWTFIVPPGATTVTAPAMPPEALPFLPVGNDAGLGTFLIPQLLFFETDILPSYASFRQRQGTFLPLGIPLEVPMLPAMPADGTYRATTWVSPL